MPDMGASSRLRATFTLSRPDGHIKNDRRRPSQPPARMPRVSACRARAILTPAEVKAIPRRTMREAVAIVSIDAARGAYGVARMW